MLILLALTLLLASSTFAPAQTSHPRPSETWRKKPPTADASRPFKLPATRETKLENGLTIVWIEDHAAPIVTIMVGIPLEISRGTLSEMTNQIALAEATAELITEGAGSRTSEQMAREVETLGGRLSSSASSDYAEVEVTVIAENAERMMDLLGDVLLHPTYPGDEVALYKRNRIQKLTVERQEPAFLADEQFDRVVFGSHPYSISSPTPASIEALDRQKIAAFHKSAFSPFGSVAVIAGDFNAVRMERKARDVFSAWRGSQRAIDKAPPIEGPPTNERRVLLVNRPASEQADFRIGGLAVKRADPDYFPMLVANAILGAGTNSRLFLNIRERKGYAYDVFSSVSAQRLGGTFYGGAETRTEVTAQAINEILAEFERMRSTKAPAEELQGAKNYLNGLFSITLSTQGGVAQRVLQTHLLNLGRDYLENYRARIEAVTAEQVQQAAQRYISTDGAAVVVVGDAQKLVESLKSIGRVQVLDLEGKPAKQSEP